MIKYTKKDCKITDYTELEHKFIDKDGKITSYYLNKKEAECFLPHITPVLGALPIVNNKITDSLKALMDGKGKLDSPIGSLTRGQVYSAIRIVFRVPRSKLYNSGDSARYKGLTPMLMYALREVQDIKYSYWDKGDENINILVGSFLWSSIKNARMPDKDQLLRDRIMQLKEVEEQKYMIVKGLETKGTKLAKLMMMQCWIASSQERCVDSQILHPTDWDVIPDLLGNAKPSNSEASQFSM